MNIENIKMYISFLTPILGLICTTAIFLQKTVKNKKLKKVLEKTEEITKNIIPLIKEAEKLTNYSGEEKKEYVITRLQQYAISNNIDLDLEYISSRIEELIELTKVVNANSDNNNAESNVIVEEKIAKLVASMKE